MLNLIKWAATNFFVYRQQNMHRHLLCHSLVPHNFIRQTSIMNQGHLFAE